MTRLTILMLVTSILASCQHSAPPTSPTVLPSPSPSPSPSPASPFDVEGGYTLTFTADESCDRLPRDVQSRTYIATVTRDGPRNFTAQLSGASFYPLYDAFFIHPLIGNVARFSLYSLFAANQWLDAIPIIERLSSGGSVSISGVANVPYDRSGPAASVPLNGSFVYCEAPLESKNAFPPDCAKPVVCESSTHTLAVTRR